MDDLERNMRELAEYIERVAFENPFDFYPFTDALDPAFDRFMQRVLTPVEV